MFSNTGNRRRPARRFRYPVTLAEQISAIRFKAYRMAGDKLRIVQRFHYQHVAQRQQQGRIGARTNRQPLRALHGAEIVTHRADVDKARSPFLHFIQPVLQHMVIGAAAVDLRITQR